MKDLTVVTIALLGLTAVPVASQTELSEPSGTKTLAATMNVYVFPAEGQATDQQNTGVAQSSKSASIALFKMPRMPARKASSCPISLRRKRPNWSIWLPAPVLRTYTFLRRPAVWNASNK